MKIKLRFDNSDKFSGRFYFYKNLITLRIGRNLAFPCFSRYSKKIKLFNFVEVLNFILSHEICHYFQFKNKLEIDEIEADNFGYEIVKYIRRGGENMKRIYANGGGGGSGGGSGKSKSSSKRSSKSKSKSSKRRR